MYIGRSYIDAAWPPQRQSKTLAFKVLWNLATAHKRAAKIAHQAGRKYKVGIAKFAAYHYAGDDAWLSKLSTQLARWAADYWLVSRLKKHLDFLGINYYRAFRYYGYRMHEATDTQNDLGWEMQPEKIEHVLKDFYDRYNLPIIVTENGVADRDDEYRKWWLTQTLLAMHRAIQGKVRLEGYLHWSLTDNFEWSSGFWPRFGLVGIDYKTKKRTIRPSAVWLGKLIKKLH